MHRKLKIHKMARMLSAAALTMSIAFTGVSAAGAPSRAPAAGMSLEAVQTDNRYESFLGFGKGAYLPAGYDGAVNTWSGNLVLQYTLPYGNLFRNLPLTLTYNSQANCNIGFGNNVVVKYWAQLTFVDANTMKMMTGTGAVDTYVKNPSTGLFECGDWYIEGPVNGELHAFGRDGEYYFDLMGRATRSHLSGSYSYVTLTYNDLGYLQSISNQEGVAHGFTYVRTETGEAQCMLLESSVDFALDYDEDGNLLSGGYAFDPDTKEFMFAYGANALITQVSMYQGPSSSVTYQNIDGYDKVVNFDGTQIVYGKNQTIAIDPNGTVTSWQFDDNGNLI